MTALLRWTIRIHKWLALLVGIQIVLWIAGGVVMSVLPLVVSSRWRSNACMRSRSAAESVPSQTMPMTLSRSVSVSLNNVILLFRRLGMTIKVGIFVDTISMLEFQGGMPDAEATV